MTSPQPVEIYQTLISLLDRARANHDELVATLSQAECDAVGEETAWQPKDHIAHLNYWRARSVKLLRAALGEGEPPESGEDFQPQNERNFTAWQHATWDEIVAELTKLDGEARALAARLSADDLTQPKRFPWQTSDRGLAPTVISDFFEHPTEHYGQLYRERGQPERGVAMMRSMLDTIGQVAGTTSREYANTLYNLGCYYARSGESAEAITAVGQALTLAPDLTEWSKQDADLDSLRALPDFQALYSR